VDFFDSLKDEFYPDGNYDDQYMRLITLHRKTNQMMLEYTNIFYTLCLMLGIKQSKKHLVLNYHVMSPRSSPAVNLGYEMDCKYVLYARFPSLYKLVGLCEC
jgi:hypothetical protein